MVGEHLRKNSKQIVIPMMLASGNYRVMVFEKPPHFRERREVVDLLVGKRRKSDPGTVVKLVVGIERGEHPVRRLVHRRAVNKHL